MKLSLTTLLPVILFFTACKKNGSDVVEGVLVRPACEPNSWVVQLNNPDPDEQEFICPNTQAMLSSSLDNCGNSAIVLNVPPSWAQAGMQVRFSRWTDRGPTCIGTFGPHTLEATDIQPQ